MIRALLLTPALLLSVGPQKPPAVPRVLVVYSTNRLVPAYAQFDSRFRHDLGPRVADADFFTEFLDLSRVPGAEHEERVAHLLHDKYASRPPSVIVAGGLQSSLFFARHRAELFPGTPIVYGGIPSTSVASVPRDSLTAVVRFDYPVRQTAELAARTAANVREIVLLSGDGLPDQRFLDDARAQLSEWTGPALTFVSDRGFDDLAAYVASLKPGTALLLLSFDHDPGGRPWAASASVAERLAHAASVPAFGPSETYVGRGIVGGVMSSLDDLSPAVAEAVTQILDGTAPSAVTTRPLAVRAVFDARELEHWHIASRALPPAAIIRFAPPSVFARNRLTFIAIGLTILLVAMLLAVIAMARRRRRAAESQSSPTVMAGALAHQLGQPLMAQQINAATALKLLDSGRLDSENAHAILTDIANAAGRASDIAHAIGQFLHNHELRKERVALDAVVTRTVPRVFAATTLDAMRVELDVTPETVLGDDVLLEQVVFNLLVNAREAVQEIAPTQGVITIRMAREGNSVRLDVIDNGPGIAAEAKEHAFDLFFTTKARGLGLGLALCRSIIEAHGGTITIERFSERGARFVARLPIAPAAADDTAAVGGTFVGVKTA